MAAFESVGAVLAVHTLDEAAAILRVRKSWLERQAAARKIPFTMLGGSYRFTSTHLAEIVRINEKAPAPAEPDVPERTAPHRARIEQLTSGRPTLTPLRARPRPTGPRRAA